jgi:hypothetical protein
MEIVKAIKVFFVVVDNEPGNLHEYPIGVFESLEEAIAAGVKAEAAAVYEVHNMEKKRRINIDEQKVAARKAAARKARKVA